MDPQFPNQNDPNQMGADPTATNVAYGQEVVQQIPGAVVEFPNDVSAGPQPVPPASPMIPTPQQPNFMPTQQYAPQVLQPGQMPVYPQPPMQPAVATMYPAQAAYAPDFDTAAQSRMRSKILKIIVGLSLFSLLGVGGLFLLSKTADKALSERKVESNNLASFDVPTSWTAESDSKYMEYFNGDTREASTAIMSVLRPQRIKFNGEALTDSEINQIMENIGDLEARNINAEVTVLSENEITVDGFQKTFEYHYQSTVPETGNEVIGTFRVYFDSTATMHTLEVAATKQYWAANQAALEELVNTYRLTGQ